MVGVGRSVGVANDDGREGRAQAERFGEGGKRKEKGPGDEDEDEDDDDDDDDGGTRRRGCCWGIADGGRSVSTRRRIATELPPMI